jgi:hypothetical protein
MPRSEKYFIGPQLLGDIRRVVGRVEAEPYRVNGVTQDVRLQDMPRRGGGGALKLGKVTAAWNKHSLRNVLVYSEGAALAESVADPVETLEAAVNKFVNVQADKWVVVGLVNGRWYLVSAEC